MSITYIKIVLILVLIVYIIMGELKMEKQMVQRCCWVNLQNPLYVAYHDQEWGKPNHDDRYLFEMLVLESFQAGLSWECILNKRENFRAAFDNFDVQKVANYDEHKIAELLANAGIIRNRLKIKAAIDNAKVFQQIQTEYGTFDQYLWRFTAGQPVVNRDGVLRATSPLSDTISRDLQKRGMRFVGSTIIYSFLQAAGVIDDHEPNCDFRK